jgi:hypothetical protein
MKVESIYTVNINLYHTQIGGLYECKEKHSRAGKVGVL